MMELFHYLGHEKQLGGFGKTYEETCGALSGALIVIGHLHGRRELGDNWDLPAELGAEISGKCSSIDLIPPIAGP